MPPPLSHRNGRGVGGEGHPAPNETAGLCCESPRRCAEWWRPLGQVVVPRVAATRCCEDYGANVRAPQRSIAPSRAPRTRYNPFVLVQAIGVVLELLLVRPLAG